MPLLVTAEDIQSAIIRINAAALGVNAIFTNCTQLDASTKSAWTAWYTGWQAWSAANNNLSYFTLGLPAIGNQAVAYENDIAGWQQDADRMCGASVPVLVPQTTIANQNTSILGLETVLSAVKWIAASVALAIVVPPIVEAFHTHVLRRPPKK